MLQRLLRQSHRDESNKSVETNRRPAGSAGCDIRARQDLQSGFEDENGDRIRAA